MKKLTNLNQNYLEGFIDAVINNYEIGNGNIPEEFKLSYEFENGRQKPIGGEQPSKDAVKIKFTWITEGERVATGDEEFPYENKTENHDDFFIILGGERISKLQNYIEEVLDKVTA